MSRDPDVFGLQVKDLAQGHLQGEEVGPGGPQQVGKHPTDLGHVLNQAKVVVLISLEMKFVTKQSIYSKFKLLCYKPKT